MEPGKLDGVSSPTGRLFPVGDFYAIGPVFSFDPGTKMLMLLDFDMALERSEFLVDMFVKVAEESENRVVAHETP